MSSAEFKWRAVRRATQAAIQAQDMLGLSQHDPSALAFAVTLASSGSQPTAVFGNIPNDGKIQAFQTWFDELLRRQVLENEGAWLEPMIAATYDRGIKSAAKMARSDVRPDDRQETIAALRQLAYVEMQGIAEAVSQRAVREVSLAILHNTKPTVLARTLTDAIQAVGVVRSRAMVNVMVIKTYGTATLDLFEAAGIKKVGLVPETFPTPRKKVGDAIFGFGGPGSRISREAAPSLRTVQRIRAAQKLVEAFEEVEVLTAGDDDVCPICEDISADGPYTIDEARSLIPAHPNCRCAFVPADDDRFAEIEIDAEWNEEDHPRAPNGEFGEGGGGSSPDDQLKKDNPSKHFRTVSKGTDDEVNARIVKDSGVTVKIVDPKVSVRDANEAVAHVVADSKDNAALLKGTTVQFKEMGSRLRGNQSGKLLTVSSEAMKEGGPGYSSGIIRHELEHKRLSDQKVPSGQQESRVQHTAGRWAAMRYSAVATTNPKAARGFKMAAIEQGIKVR